MPVYGQNNMSLMPASQPNPTLPPQGGWIGANYNQQPYGNSWQQNYGQPYPNQAQRLPQINNVIRVMGPESAMSYKVGENSMVMMLDSNRPVFYIKRTDDSGYPDIKAYEFHEIPFREEKTVDVTPMDTSNMATKEDIEELKKQLNRRDTVSKKDLDALKKMIEGMGVNHG